MWRLKARLPELFMWCLIAVVGLLNIVIYGGVVRGEDAVSLLPTPEAGSPLVLPTQAPSQEPDGLSPSQLAERDESADLPGTFVATQGRRHTEAYPVETRVPFCEPDRVSDECYASNPPTSGLHYPVQGTVLLEDGNRLKLPPDPGIYDFPVPREAIPHIQEHAGVYVGYNCSSSDCDDAAERLIDLVDQEISLGGRVVISPDPDLETDTIGLAAWTRFDVIPIDDFDDERAREFIKAHSCRFDPEGFCPETPVN